MAGIFESLMKGQRSLRSGSSTKKCESTHKKIPYKKFKVESFRIFEDADADLNDLDNQFATDPEESSEDEVVLIIDPELGPDDEVPDDAAEQMVGDIVYKCPNCGAKYVCDSEECSLDLNEDGVPSECPVCGEEGEQILVGEIGPVDNAGEETEMEPMEVDETEPEDDTDETDLEVDDEFKEESTKRRKVKESEEFTDLDAKNLVRKYSKGVASGAPYKEAMYDRTYAVGLKDSMKAVNAVGQALTSDGFTLADSADGEYYAYTKVTDSGDKIVAGIFYQGSDDFYGGSPGEDSLILQVTVNPNPEDEELMMYFDESVKMNECDKTDKKKSLKSKFGKKTDEESVKKESTTGRRPLKNFRKKSESLKEDDELEISDAEVIDPMEPVPTVDDDDDPKVKVSAEVVNINFDDKKFESLITDVIRENYKNRGTCKVRRVSSSGSSLKVEYVIREGRKTRKGILVGEGYNPKSRRCTIKFRDKGAFTESYGKTPAFIVEFVRVRDCIVPVNVKYDYKVKVNESVYRVYGKVGK